MEWVLETELDLNDLLEYEARANDVWLCQEGPVNPVICTYDLTRFRGDIVADVMRTHPLIILGGSYKRTRSSFRLTSFWDSYAKEAPSGSSKGSGACEGRGRDGRNS